MNQIKIKYGLDERPPLHKTLIFGLQWLAVTIAAVVIIGKVVAGLHFDEPARQLLYMQKLFFIMGLSLFLQLIWGHKLPLITGPASVLLIGILAGAGRDINAIYTTIAIGGALQAVLSATGLFAKITKLFTSRVVATILILIALTITPTILNLIVTAKTPEISLLNLLFALCFFAAMITADRVLPGIWKATMLVWAIIFGAFAYMIVGSPEIWLGQGEVGIISNFFKDFTIKPVFDPGLLISFFVCFIALAINDLGSIQSIGRLINPPGMEKRTKNGITITGISNILAGFFGVIGSVNFSMSAGIIADNGNASRFTMIPTSAALILTAFFPGIVIIAWNVPSVVVGVLLLYIMCAQMAAGLMVAFSQKGFSFQDGLVIGIPAMISILVSYLPLGVKDALPSVLVPVIGNGFVMGVVAVMILEHIAYKPSNIKQ
ncbi:MAG: purine/pyrimidine permease [Desulforegulaceae bacterium]|nr:purine/pyrimidine permease [Desulforegulaceae bacterium]